MTDLEWWWDWARVMLVVDFGWLRLEIPEEEARARTANEWNAYVWNRLAPWLWLSMPVHDKAQA